MSCFLLAEPAVREGVLCRTLWATAIVISLAVVPVLQVVGAESYDPLHRAVHFLLPLFVGLGHVLLLWFAASQYANDITSKRQTPSRLLHGGMH